MSSVASQMWVVVLCCIPINISGSFLQRQNKTRSNGSWKGSELIVEPVKRKRFWNQFEISPPLCATVSCTSQKPLQSPEKRECFNHLHNTGSSFIQSADDCLISITASLTWSFYTTHISPLLSLQLIYKKKRKMLKEEAAAAAASPTSGC